MLIKIKENKKKYFILLIVILTVLSSLNIFHNGIISNHDINFHLHRILAISDNIRIGRITPIYFNYLNGFGYGNGLFYPDIFLYFPGFLKYIGFSLEYSYKIFIILINFVSIYTMYLCVKKITNSNKCAYISMTLYSCSIYRLIDLVERGSLGETIAFAFLPLVILGIYEILYGNHRNGFYLTIGLSGVCLSHIISFYLTCIFLVLATIINLRCLKDRKRFISLLINTILSIMITCFFWAPLLEQIISDKFNFSACQPIFETIVPVLILFIDFPIAPALENWYPSGIGLIYYYGLFIFIKKLINDKFKCDNKFLFTLFILSLTFILISCCTFVWKIDIVYKCLSFIQFPWRFNIISTVILTVAFSIMIKEIKFNIILKTFLIYTIIAFLANVVLYSYNVYFKEVAKDEIMTGEYLPENFDYGLIYNYKNDAITYEKNNYILNVIMNKKEDFVELPLIYYKGYKACNNDKCFKISKSNNGLVNIKIDNEKTNFTVIYEGTRIYNYSKFVSIAGVLAFLFYKKINVKKCR